LILNIY